MRMLFVAAPCVLSLFAVASCGGGGGGGTGGGDPPSRATFTLGPTSLPLVNGLYTPPHTLLFADSRDLDDDGFLDLVWNFRTTFNSNPLYEVGTHGGAGDGTFPDFDGSSGYAPATGVPPVACGDVMGVGKGGIVLAQQLFPASFFVDTTAHRPGGDVGGTESATGVLGGLVLGDWTGDGIADVAALDVTALRIVAWASLGEAGLAPVEPTLLPAGTAVSALAAGDFDGDTHDDVAVATGDGGYLVLTWTTGTTFTVSPVVSLGGPAFVSLVSGDFDGDGLADLAGVVAESGFPARVGVLLGAGDGTFGALLLATLAPDLGASSLLHLRAGDFDGDGVDDLAFVAPAANRTAVLFADGAGGLEEAVDADLTGGAHDTLGAADVDGDGDLDLLIGNAVTLEIRVLFNDRL